MSTRVAEQVSTSYAPPEPSGAQRLQSIDIVRGVVMILMAIDHVRVYAGVPAGGPDPAIFFTRWVTHFCAPLFVFLAGTSAFFNGRKLGDMGRLSRFLLTRGGLLVVLELTLIKFFWTFGLDYESFTLAGVIWMLGWCMILLGGLVRLSPRFVGWLGVGIVVLQQVFLVPGHFLPAIRPFWEFVYTTEGEGLPAISVLYVIVPWIGVMAAGYGFGLILEKAREERDRLLLRLGLAMTAVYLIAGSALALRPGGDDNALPFVFRLLNQQKYPASQLFLLMTLGPAIALMPFAERARGAVAQTVATIGRVPMFYYLAHIPLIHLSALAVNAVRSGSAHPEWYATAPFAQVPEEGRWPLVLLYAVFVADVVLLAFACRWYARIRRERPAAWMRYL